MQTYRGAWPDLSDPRAVLTIGNFDGVHLGHQAIFNQLKSRAREIGGRSTVLTFHPHPRRYFRPEDAPFLLCSEEERIRLIDESGIDCLVIADFNEELANLTPERFVHEIIVEKLGATTVFVGYDFNFGSGRQGGYETLKEICAPLGIEAHLVKEVLFDGETISSSRIRHRVARGDMAGARELLGRSYRLIGPVEKGKRLGIQLGYPTANLAFGPRRLLPALGVYAAWAIIDNKRYLSAVNIGYRPTIEDNLGVKVEAFLLDYPGEALYDHVLELRFIEYLRGEIKFDNLDALKRQIGQDVQTIIERHGTIQR